MIRKHTIIVGGTKSVGRELALILAGEGQVVTAVGRRVAAFPAFDSGGEVRGYAGDAGDPEALLAGLKEQVAGVGLLSSLVLVPRYRGTGDAFAGEMAIAVTAAKVLVEGLADAFAADGDRSICLVTSNAGTFVARNQSLGYHTAKAAARQLARYYAVRLGPRGIRVNVVAPCTFVKPESAEYYAKPELQGLYARITPLARMGTAREVAEAVAFLCGPRASFITGQELAVDGGLSLMLQDAMAREVAGLSG